MIVGTEGPDVIQDEYEDQEQGEVKETPPAQGQTTDDGGPNSPEQQQPQQQQQQQQQQQEQQPPSQGNAKGGGGSSGTGGGASGSGAGGGGTPGGGGAATGGGSADPTKDIADSLALAEMMKPLEGPTADLFSPDKAKARNDLAATYKKAIDKEGDLRVKLDRAHKAFERAAADTYPRLEKWLLLLGSDKAIGKLFAERKETREKLEATMSELERKRFGAQEKTKQWADAYANWSSPADKMLALVGEYSDKIDKLNGEVNTSDNPNAALLSFWLEVAPKHMQLTDRPLDDEAKKAVDAVRDKLAPLGLDYKLRNGKIRKDGSLYVLKESELQGARVFVLSSWIDAAKESATAEANFKRNADSAASLKKRWDELKDDGWLNEAKSKLEKSST